MGAGGEDKHVKSFVPVGIEGFLDGRCGQGLLAVYGDDREGVG